MKVVILAGGFGTRISEESHLKPKPMIEIGERPILWHIMKCYSHYGYNEFIICLGYKAYMIKEFFADYYLHNSDITFDFSNGNKMIVHNNFTESWKVTLIDTGLNTMTGGRIRRIKDYIGNEPFMMTYGDGLSDIDFNELVNYHFHHGKKATLTAVQPEGKFGILGINSDNAIIHFSEKNKEDNGWINGGFMVLNPEVFDLLEGDSTVFEKDPLKKLTQLNQLRAYKHDGFWQCMDTQRDKQLLEGLWLKGQAPWKTWN